MTILIPNIRGAKILFDASRSETSGNADWVIDEEPRGGGSYYPQRYPDPNQCLVDDGTEETFWLGALSNWAIELVKAGYWVETLPPNSRITFGDCNNPQDLSFYDVFVIPEPQNPFFSSEIDAIYDFLASGGAVFFIANHCGSSRNNNAYDSATIFNLMNIKENLGFEFDLQEDCDFSEAGNSNFRNDPSDPILHGPFGDINPIGFARATTMNVYPEYNSSVRALAWRRDVSHSSTTRVTLLRGTYYNGRFVAIGDSSPCDDGTGNPNDHLVDGWRQNRKLFLNATIWLAQNEPSSNYTPCPNATPTPGCPTPTPSPTPSGGRVEIDIQTNQSNYMPNDHFLLTVTIINRGPAMYVDEYIILEAYGQYWFWPSWEQRIDYKRFQLKMYENTTETILDFIWPQVSNSGSATFWAALMVPNGTTEDDLLSYSFVSFGWF